jgi:hypothetical protein
MHDCREKRQAAAREHQQAGQRQHGKSIGSNKRTKAAVLVFVQARFRHHCVSG